MAECFVFRPPAMSRVGKVLIFAGSDCIGMSYWSQRPACKFRLVLEAVLTIMMRCLSDLFLMQ
jgi:hypothetical protein